MAFPLLPFAGVLYSIYVTEHTVGVERKPKATCGIPSFAFCWNPVHSIWRLADAALFSQPCPSRIQVTVISLKDITVTFWAPKTLHSLKEPLMLHFSLVCQSTASAHIYVASLFPWKDSHAKHWMNIVLQYTTRSFSATRQVSCCVGLTRPPPILILPKVCST